jgi:hypothetical protein
MYVDWDITNCRCLVNFTLFIFTVILASSDNMKCINDGKIRFSFFHVMWLRLLGLARNMHVVAVLWLTYIWLPYCDIHTTNQINYCGKKFKNRCSRWLNVNWIMVCMVRGHIKKNRECKRQFRTPFYVWIFDSPHQIFFYSFLIENTIIGTIWDPLNLIDL